MNDERNSAGRIQLDGFEDAIIACIAANFRFEGPYLSNVPLKVGRHLFVQDLRNTDELIADAKAAGEDFDPEKEPIMAVYTEPIQGLAPSSSRGGRHEWTLRVIMRLGVVMEECKARLEELTEWLNKDFRGMYVDRYAVKACNIQVRPAAFQIEDSEQAYCEVQLHLFAVPRVTA